MINLIIKPIFHLYLDECKDKNTMTLNKCKLTKIKNFL